MDTKYLKTFIQVAERSSFTKAAEALNYTQSTVSSQIKQLETEFQTQLFERINHTVTLTDPGRILLQQAHQIVNLAEEMKADPADGENCEGLVRFGMVPSVCSVMMGSTYLTFHQMFPNVLVKILEGDTEHLLQLLHQNDVDLVFLVDRRSISADYVVVSEKKEAVHFVASKNSDLSGKKGLRINDILQYPFFLSEKGLSYRRIFDEMLAERNLAVEPMVEMGNAQLLLELAELSEGITLLPDYVTRKSFSEGRIVYLDIEDFEIEIWRQLIYHKNKWVSPAMKKVIDYCSRVSETEL